MSDIDEGDKMDFDDTIDVDAISYEGLDTMGIDDTLIENEAHLADKAQPVGNNDIYEENRSQERVQELSTDAADDNIWKFMCWNIAGSKRPRSNPTQASWWTASSRRSPRRRPSSSSTPRSWRT